MIEKKIPELIVMVGLSGSGKSTKAKELATIHNAQIISSDAIRKELWGDEADQRFPEEVFTTLQKRMRQFLQNGQSVIVDATNLTMKSRRCIMECTRKIPCKKIAYIMATPIYDCKRHDHNRTRQVGDSVIEEQRTHFQVPFPEEGFDEIIIHAPKYSSEKFLGSLLEMDNFDQQNPWHNGTIGEHSVCSFQEFQKYSYSKDYELGALLHDFGKLKTQSFEEKDGSVIRHYYRHDKIGAYELLCRKSAIQELTGYSEEAIINIAFIANYHMLIDEIKRLGKTDKWQKRFGEERFQILSDFNECDKKRLSSYPNYSCADTFLNQFCQLRPQLQR